MSTEALFQRVKTAERTLSKELESAEQLRIATIGEHQTTVRKRVKETLAETTAMKGARENIEHLQLRLELLRNIKMNWRGFQESLKKKEMNLRINQHAHLHHLIAFLETGRGVAIDGKPLTGEDVESALALMTHEVQPTGAGKTGAFAIDIALMDVPSLILVPFDSLLDQTRADLIKIGSIREDQIGIMGGGSKDIGCKHTIATYAGHVAQMRKGGEYARFMKTQCKLVICDEVHHQALGDRMQGSIKEIDTLSNGEPTDEEVEMLAAERDVVSHLAEQSNVKSLKIGFTATPRGSQKNVQTYFPHRLGRVYHKQMVEAGLVVPYKIVHVDGSVREGEIDEYVNQETEAKILEREKIYSKMTEEYADLLATYRKTKSKTDMPLRGMAFCTNHKECEKFATEAEFHGIKCRIVTGKEAAGRKGQSVIDAAVDALNAEEIDLIITVEKLATGFNKPEINAIVWARITSAAKTIQGIGRGARAYTDKEGRQKQECLVFETNWSLQKGSKKGRRPMRLADSLAFNGEDPEAICSMADGSQLDIYQRLSLEDDGTVDIQGRTAVGLSMYAKKRIPKIAIDSLEKYTKAASLAPVKNVQVYSGQRPVEVFWKDEVEAALPRRLNPEGVVDIDGREAVGITAYANNLVPPLDPYTLLNRIREHEMQPIPNVLVTSGASSAIDVYWKDEVDRLIPKRLNPQGTVDIDGKEAVGIGAYTSAPDSSVSEDFLRRMIKEKGLKAVDDTKVLSGSTYVDVYWKNEVDALIPKRLRIDGTVDLNGRQAVALKAYVQHSKVIDILTIRKYVKSAGLQPVSDVRVLRGAAPVEVYWKSDVDALLRERGKI
jgi:superfamily II DNA or RNA helicase